ncbi:MAG: hypothetical protein M1832_003128 [Thelocarpon impressellum]|nr:MAG: hypothetical protein M1832_003128 [Thelocarpon impressellum]
MEPEDLYAMAALFRKANEIAIELRCRPEEYPIKAVYGGGGYNSDFWHLHLQYYLAILQTHGIVPDPRMFDIHTQAYKGPTSLEHEKNCYDIFPDGTPTPPTHRAMLGEQTTLSSVKATIGPIMEQLRSQSAPIIVALRPLYEFAILWTEYSLNQTQPSDRLGETMLLEGLVRLYFHRLHYPHLAHTQEFFSGASDLAQRLSDMMERQLRGRRVPGALSLPKRVVMRWAQYAWLGDSGVAANGILLPFCLDRRSNLVRESFRKVTYGGLRNTDWRYVWPDAPYSASTVWFTNTSTLPGDAAVDPDERERRMHREIKELYISAVTPLVVG